MKFENLAQKLEVLRCRLVHVDPEKAALLLQALEAIAAQVYLAHVLLVDHVAAGGGVLPGLARRGGPGSRVQIVALRVSLAGRRVVAHELIVGEADVAKVAGWAAYDVGCGPAPSQSGGPTPPRPCPSAPSRGPSAAGGPAATCTCRSRRHRGPATGARRHGDRSERQSSCRRPRPAPAATARRGRRGRVPRRSQRSRRGPRRASEAGRRSSGERA